MVELSLDMHLDFVCNCEYKHTATLGGSEKPLTQWVGQGGTPGQSQVQVPLNSGVSHYLSGSTGIDISRKGMGV